MKEYSRYNRISYNTDMIASHSREAINSLLVKQREC